MKYLRFFFINLFVIYSFNISSQDKNSVLERQLNISILYPGVSAEFPLSDYFSIIPKVGLGFSFDAYYSSFGGSNFDYIIAPTGNLQGRFYYAGLKEQTRKGKELFRNSGNYGFFQLSGNLPPIASSFRNSYYLRYSVGIGWGLQRIYKNNVLLSWGLGLGFDSYLQSGTWINEFTLGYAIRPRTEGEVIDFR